VSGISRRFAFCHPQGRIGRVPVHGKDDNLAASIVWIYCGTGIEFLETRGGFLGL